MDPDLILVPETDDLVQRINRAGAGSTERGDHGPYFTGRQRRFEVV